MSARHNAWRTRRAQRGYALLLVLFAVTLLLIAAVTIGPNLLTQDRREKEEEMIWRGQQYVRGIKLFYRKNGRFPSSLEDLTKPKTGVRFLRAAYKDPMNTQDGSWRLIYVGPGGQLIGSSKQRPAALQIPGATPAAPPASGAPSGQTGAPLPGTAGGDASGAQTGQAGFASSEPAIFGGNIIGVGSKVRRRSIKVYEKGVRYSEWEFIWDPAKDVLAVGQPGMQTGAPIGQPIGQPVAAPPGTPPPGAPPNPPLFNPQ
ncbi:MAG: hypothetical protein LAN84_01790 [Acidobacteriia bacterium]|nr:hypothetical protein [Terriglobia bacterium]